MNDNNNKQQKKTGRRPKKDPANIRYTISFNEQEHARFLALFDKSGMQVKAHFITSCIFDKTIKTIQIDKGTVDFLYAADLFSQPVPFHRRELQPNCKAVVQEFFGEKSRSIPVQTGKTNG